MALRSLRRLHHPHHRLFSSLADDINAISRILSDYRSPHHDLLTALQPFTHALSHNPSLLDHLLKRCRHLPSAAHRLFLLTPNPSPLSQRLLIQVLASSRQFPLAWAHLSDLHHDHNPILTPDLFSIFFFAYAKADLPSDALKVFDKMPDFGFDPDTDQFNLLLYALCRNGHVSDAQIFFHASKHKFEVTQKTYSILMQGWGSVGKFEDAVNLFDEMVERKIAGDVAAYNALIAALCKGGEIEEAGRRMKEMKMVHGLDPDAGTYAVFIRAYCEVKDSRGALRMVENMKRKGLAPNVFTYNCVIRLLCEEEENAEEAYQVLDEMIERGVEPDVWSYNRILGVHCKLREANKAVRLLKRMDEDGCSPNKHTYNMLIKMLIGVGRIEWAVEVWDGMQKRRYYPSACNYAVMIHGLCRKKGRAEEASRYFEVMVDEGIPPYVSTCVLLRSELLRLGSREKVEVLADRMKKSTSCTIQELAIVMETGKEIEK